MPAGKRRQSNAMLYTLVTFIGLCIVATTFAVIYYVKAEEYRTQADKLQQQTDEVATREEVRRLGNMVGTKLPRQSRLATMIDYLDKTVTMVIGGPPEITSAEVKVNNAAAKMAEILKQVQQHIDISKMDPNTISLISIVVELQTKLNNTIAQKTAVEQQLADLRKRFDDSIAATQEKEQTLSAEKEKLQQQVGDIKKSYDELKTLTQQTSEERVKTLMAQIDQERANLKNVNDELLKTQAQLKMAQERMKGAVEQVQQIQPAPDREASAYEPDGKILLVDETAGVVRLNIGSDERVYRGLTFSVYDKARSIPKDGKPKAEIEVFELTNKTAAARIVSSQKTNPIAEGDLAANLIWDSKKTNRFVVAGEFDLNGDGTADYDAIDRIKGLIEKWGGKTSDTVSADTDYVILGNAPAVPPKPSFEDLQVDPAARDKYNAAVQKLEQYQAIQGQAQALWIPIFTYERFLYFTGYKGKAGKSGAF
jgi:hypothetical protein